MKKKTTADTPQTPVKTEQATTNNTEQPHKPRHPDADYLQKTTFGYVGAYA